MGRPDFGGHEHVTAPHAGAAQSFPNLALVLIKLRRIEMPIAQAKRLLHDAPAHGAAQFPGAKPKERDAGTIGLHHRGLCSPVHTRTPLAAEPVLYSPTARECRICIGLLHTLSPMRLCSPVFQ